MKRGYFQKNIRLKIVLTVFFLLILSKILPSGAVLTVQNGLLLVLKPFLWERSPSVLQLAYDEITVKFELLQREKKDLQEALEHERSIVASFYASPPPSLERRFSEHTKRLEDVLNAVPARVLFQEGLSWPCAVWVDIGSFDAPLKKNALVFSRGYLVGLVEDVEETLCKVRLISDPNLRLAVRAERNGEYLAKGLLEGSFSPAWRKSLRVLKGSGFNYDFDDEEGPRRQLHTGRAYGEAFSDDEAISLIQEGDVLVTSGLDGLIPKGFPVAKVTYVEPLHEASYAYTIQAQALAQNLDDLDLVFIGVLRGMQELDSAHREEQYQ